MDGLRGGGDRVDGWNEGGGDRVDGWNEGGR